MAALRRGKHETGFQEWFPPYLTIRLNWEQKAKDNVKTEEDNVRTSSASSNLRQNVKNVQQPSILLYFIPEYCVSSFF